MSVVYSNKYNDPVKVNDFCLLKFTYPLANRDFVKADYSYLQGVGYHYIDVDSVKTDVQGQVVSYEADLKSVVWDRGNQTYSHRKNWSFSQGVLYTPPSSQVILNNKFIKISFYIPQLFSWEGIHGLLLTIKGCESDDIYINRLFTINDFEYNNEKLLKDQIFWLESTTFNIPDSNEEFYAQCTIIKDSDINVEGYIYNYPTFFQPIIQSKPLPDYIITRADLDNAGFLHLVPDTLEDKTLENSLKDYFGYSRDKSIPITIQHVITYSGINLTTGYKENTILRVSNEENNFNEVVVGIDLSRWIDVDNPEQKFVIDIATEINVDSKLMTRYTTVIADLTTEVVNLLASQSVPQYITQEKVEEVTQVNQTVINKPVETQIVKIYQPIFVKYIEKDVQYQNVRISFANLTEDCYLMVEDDYIESHITSDGIYYFDLSELNPITQDTEYQIVTKNGSIVIGSGMLTIDPPTTTTESSDVSIEETVQDINTRIDQASSGISESTAALQQSAQEFTQVESALNNTLNNLSSQS